MSDTAGKSSSRPSSGKGSYRNRRGPASGRRPRNSKPREEAKPAATTTTAAPAEKVEVVKKERPEFAPVPESLIGSNQSGTVAVTIRNRKYNFGFISLGFGEKVDDSSVPRVYYNPSLISTEDRVNLYRGYEVEFTIGRDEENRIIAKDIRLTENGKKIKEQRDAEVAQKRQERLAERAAATPAATAAATDNTKDAANNGAGKPRAEGVGNSGRGAGRSRRRNPRRERKPSGENNEETGDRPAPRKVTLQITVEGDAKKKGSIDFVLNRSIGTLKSLAAKTVEAPMDYSVYLVTKENPQGEFVTRALLNTVGETATILLAPKRAEDNK